MDRRERFAPRHFRRYAGNMTVNLGDQLNRILNVSRSLVFDQGECAQHTFVVFQRASKSVDSGPDEEITIQFPIGVRPDKSIINGTRKYTKVDLKNKYHFLSNLQLAANSLVSLVTIVDAMFSDILRAVILKYPKKLGNKRTVPMQLLLTASSFAEAQFRCADTLLNELSYKSPLEFADSFQEIASINLRECSSFHKYTEIKATRDIMIHNSGIANDIYTRKAGSHARVKSGEPIPVNVLYFLDAYETCLQIFEWMENELHEQWHSSELEFRRKNAETRKTDLPAPPVSIVNTDVPVDDTKKGRKKKARITNGSSRAQSAATS